MVRCWESKHGVRSRAAAHSPCGEIHPQSLTNKVCQVLGCSFRVTTAIHNFNSWIIPYNQTLQCPTAPMNRGIISYGPSCWGVGDSPPVTALQRAIKRAERSLSWVSCLLANIFTLRNLVIPRARTGDSLNDTHFPPEQSYWYHPEPSSFRHSSRSSQENPQHRSSCIWLGQMLKLQPLRKLAKQRKFATVIDGC